MMTSLSYLKSVSNQYLFLPSDPDFFVTIQVLELYGDFDSSIMPYF